MEHLDHENLSLYVLSTFSTYHGRTCLLFLLVLSPFFQITMTQPHSKSFCIEPSTLFLRDIKWHCIGRVFIILWYAITKYIFSRLDKQWYQSPIDLIAYKITTVLSILASHLIRDHHHIYIDCKYISYLSLSITVFSCNLFLTKFQYPLLLIHF